MEKPILENGKTYRIVGAKYDDSPQENEIITVIHTYDYGECYGYSVKILQPNGKYSRKHYIIFEEDYSFEAA